MWEPPLPGSRKKQPFIWQSLQKWSICHTRVLDGKRERSLFATSPLVRAVLRSWVHSEVEVVFRDPCGVPSATFRHLPPPSATFSYVQLRSATFSYVQLPSATFSYLQQPPVACGIPTLQKLPPSALPQGRRGGSGNFFILSRKCANVVSQNSDSTPTSPLRAPLLP